MTTEASTSLLRSTSLIVDEKGAAALPRLQQWNGPLLNLYRSGGQAECGPSHTECPTLILGLSGCEGRRWHRENGKTVELAAAPGMVDLYGRDYQREWARWDLKPGATVGVQLTPQLVNRLVPHLPGFDIATRAAVSDPKLQWLVEELLSEARAGAPGGMLYAESLTCALIARLAQAYGPRRAAGRPPGGLSESRRRRVADYIDAHLGEPLGIADLARESMLSPDHFSRSFTVSFGLPPHRYVQQRRIDAASRMLRSGRSITDIALELGFYSHTHFTRVFREHTGTTPTRLRSTFV